MQNVFTLQPYLEMLTVCGLNENFKRIQEILDLSTARVSLAEVFHPWVRWEGPGSGFENWSSGAGAGGGVWKSRIHRFGPLGIEVEKQGFRTAWFITGQKFP